MRTIIIALFWICYSALIVGAVKSVVARYRSRKVREKYNAMSEESKVKTTGNGVNLGELCKSLRANVEFQYSEQQRKMLEKNAMERAKEFMSDPMNKKTFAKSYVVTSSSIGGIIEVKDPQDIITEMENCPF